MAKLEESPESVPAWLLWPVRVIAVAVVLPFRLAGTALTAVGRFLSRFLLAPLAWLGRHLIVIPATWAWRNLVVIPLTWAWRTLVVVPLSWLWRTLLVPPGRWLGKALVKLAGWILAIPLILIGVPLMWLWENAVVPGARLFHRWVLRPIGTAARLFRDRILAPAGRGIAWFLRLGRQGTSWLFRQLYRGLLRPVGRAAAWVWRHTFGALFRGLGHVWRSLIVPAGRWVRDEVLRPAGAAVRSVLASLGLR